MCRRDTFKVRALLCLRADLALVTRGGRLAYGGDIVAARDLHQDTLASFRRVLGEDHPDTLILASRVADDLRALGEADSS